MTEQEKLKPCPFCGGKATLLLAKDDNDFDTVFCRNSYCELWDTFTVEQWNTRAKGIIMNIPPDIATAEVLIITGMITIIFLGFIYFIKGK